MVIKDAIQGSGRQFIKGCTPLHRGMWVNSGIWLRSAEVGHDMGETGERCGEMRYGRAAV